MLLAGAGHIVQCLTKCYLRNRSVHVDNLIAMSFKLKLQGSVLQFFTFAGNKTADGIVIQVRVALCRVI